MLYKGIKGLLYFQVSDLVSLPNCNGGFYTVYVVLFIFTCC
jgi:hypothetical protein